MVQFSVYFRFCPGKDKAQALTSKIERLLPNGGNVQLLTITDKQYENIISLENRKPVEKNKREQLVLL